MSLRRVLLAGGGTGGHLFPGLAVLEALEARLSGLEAHWVGTSRGLEARVVPSRGIPLHRLRVRPLKGRGIGGGLRGLSVVPRALRDSVALLRSVRPDLVLGVGGYASGPLLLAAGFLRIPTAVLEQNARVGLTNRLLAPVAGRAYVSFPETASCFPAARVRVLGNPVRHAFVEAARRAAADPEGVEQRADRVVVLGGSQGARRLNEVVPEALASADLGAHSLRIVHQTGASALQEVRRRYERLGLEAEVVPFLEDVAGAMLRAAVVVARAGATTVAELCAIGRPALLVPYPHAADDHQRANAEALQRRGAACCVLERDLSAGGLGRRLADLLADEPRRLRMAAAARALGRPEAAGEIAEDLIEWLDGGERLAGASGEPNGSDGHEEEGGTVARVSTDLGERGNEEMHGVSEAGGYPSTGRRTVRLAMDEGIGWTRAALSRSATRPRGQRPYVPVRRYVAGRRGVPRLLADPELLELD